MLRILLTVLMAVILLSPASAKYRDTKVKPAVKLPSVTEYFNMKVGTVRVFLDINGGKPKTLTVTTILRRQIGTEVVLVNELAISFGHRSVRKQLYFETVTPTKHWRGFLKKPGMYALAGPIKVGTTWRAAHNVVLSIASVGKVKTTAGTFDGVVVKYKNIYFYYAKGLGLVKVAAFRTVKQDGSMVQTVLLDLVKVTRP